MPSATRAFATAAMCCILATAASLSIVRAQQSDTTLAVNEAAVGAALRSPERLWAFVTAPETRWADRMAAAWRAFPEEKRMEHESRRLFVSAGMDVYGSAPAPRRFLLPMRYFPRVVAARNELERERWVHQWGLRHLTPPGSRAASNHHIPYTFTGERRRIVLGHVWMVPVGGAGDAPTSPQDERFGPWPAQVETVLEILYRGFEDTTRPAEFFAAALSLPCATRADAESLVTETRKYASTARAVTPEVVGAWRNAALNPAFPRMVDWVEQGFYAIGVTRTDQAFWLGQALYVDLVDHVTDGDMPMLSIYLDWLDTDTRPGWEIVRPAPPHAATYALARRVAALPDSIAPYKRRDAAHEVLEMADSAAAARLPEATQTDSTGNERAFAWYRAWYAQKANTLARAASGQTRRVEAARRSMTRTSVCRAP
ncbi:MAG TPA: hypothetical protein VFH27_10785, partial [Longimicrobiaceae bacterium]|nr:hypothetical protein [Longimicrobiaceae bacterium]